MIAEFQEGEGAGALVLSLKAGGTGLNLTAANHVVLYDRWWNPAVEDQARDRAWRIGQTRTVVSHRLVCPGTVDERVEEVVAGKRHIADLVLPESSSLADLEREQLRVALGLRTDALLTDDPSEQEASHDVSVCDVASEWPERPRAEIDDRARPPPVDVLPSPPTRVPPSQRGPGAAARGPVAAGARAARARTGAPGGRRHRPGPLARRPAPAGQPATGRGLPGLGGRAGRRPGDRAGGQR